MTSDNYKTNLDKLLVSELELLLQAHRRLRTEGAVGFAYSFQDFLDIIFAKGEWDSMHLDGRI